MSIYLTYRLRNGKRHGPYGMNGNQYLGAVTVKDDLVFSKVDGSCLGALVRRTEIPKQPERASVESAIRELFYVPLFTVQNIEDIRDGCPFNADAVDAAVATLVGRGVLERVCEGNYRMVI